jgi:hypothetical protein
MKENVTVHAASVHPDLLTALKQVCQACGLCTSIPEREAESFEYGAYTFTINGANIWFRVAKTTPTTVGQFVTLWKRVGQGPTQPFDQSDLLDLLVVSTRSGLNAGQFVFLKAALCEHGVMSVNGAGGKRAMRVYPPWVITTNQQAQKTQVWQSAYFLDMPQAQALNVARVRLLFDCGSR